MKKYLNKKINSKSTKDKKHLATICAAVVTVIIVLIWLFVLFIFRSDSGNNESQSKTFFDSFFEEVGEKGAEIKKEFQKGKEGLEVYNSGVKAESILNTEAFKDYVPDKEPDVSVDPIDVNFQNQLEKDFNEGLI